MFKRIRHPELFQGRLNNKNYFEGWYFKHVTADGSRTIAFIPGISLDHADSHAFVQVIVSPGVRTFYFRYPIEAFSVSDWPFSVSIGNSVFSLEGCKIDLSDEKTGDEITGEFLYKGLTPIKTSVITPNIMGFFAYIPGMECNHGVLSMNHGVGGHVCINSTEIIDFIRGKGYIEKDWGTSFPSAYIWIQANDFEQSGDGFMCSIATIPFGLFSFRGLIANLQVGGEEYRFATYNRSKVSAFHCSSDKVSFELSKGDVTLAVSAQLLESGALKAPEKGEMQRTIKEGLGGNVSLVLMQKGHPPKALTSGSAGIEIVWK